jgi:hypothetical protein
LAESRQVILSSHQQGDSQLPLEQPQTVDQKHVASRRLVLFTAGLGAVTLALAVVVSFLAASTTSEARAPGIAEGPPAATPTPEPPPPIDFGPTSIYLEPALILALKEQPPADGTTVPDLLAAAPHRISPPPPQAPLGTPLVTTKGPIENVNITFYDCANQGFCGDMYNGQWVYEGAAACSWNLPIDTAFYIVGDPTQRIYVCKDRGLLDDTWVDIFWYHPDDGYNWQSFVGRYGTIFIVYLPK